MARDTREKALGLEHPHTAKASITLAGLQRGPGDLVAARPLYKRALAICEKAPNIHAHDALRVTTPDSCHDGPRVAFSFQYAKMSPPAHPWSVK